MISILLTIVITVSGLLIGFLAQRSRMCFVAGFRDYLIVRDKELLMGLVSFVLTVWVLSSIFSAAGLLHTGVPLYGGGKAAATVSNTATGSAGENQAALSLLSVFSTRFFYVTLAGGFLIGLLSVFAGGCVMRQHVLLAQGSRDAVYYLAGFYVAVVCYYTFLQPLFSWVYQ